MAQIEWQNQCNIDLSSRNRWSTLPSSTWTNPESKSIYHQSAFILTRCKDLLRVSTNIPDESALRFLATNEKDQRVKREAPEILTDDKFQPVTWVSTALACGYWAFVKNESKNELVFIQEARWTYSGIAKFGQRSLILKLNNGFRLDFRYAAILETFMQKSPQAITLSMSEAPRVFGPPDQQSDIDGLATMLRYTTLSQNRTGPERARLPYLDARHKPIIEFCLVYRIDLLDVSSDMFNENYKKMNRIAYLNKPNPHRIRINSSTISLGGELLAFRQTLSSLDLGLPFEIVFQLQKLVQNNYLRSRTALRLIPHIRSIFSRSGLEVCANAVCMLFAQIDYPSLEIDGSIFEHQNLVDLLNENEKLSLYKETTNVSDDIGIMEDGYRTQASMSANEVMIHRVRITPSGMTLGGPEPESNNRVLRKYSKYLNHFLRVTFGDEDGGPLRQSFKVSHERIFDERFKNVLNNGIEIAGRQYYILGFSHSSLRMQTCWFMAPFFTTEGLIDDRRIIRELGDFTDIQCPAKCAARIGQAFSDTPNTIKITSHNEIPDVERNWRVFSDGVGTISREVCDEIFENLKRPYKYRPTCFQIRYQGAKGMLALDSCLEGKSINLRPSMVKFGGSTSDDLEICGAASRPLPLYLNRQLIKILEDMGVDDKFFLDLQAEEVETLRMVTCSAYNASYFLTRLKIGDALMLPNLLQQLYDRGIDFQHDGFLRHLLEVAIFAELRQIKYKSRILVKKGWHLYGIMDETDLLEEGQVFCTVVVDGKSQIIVGNDLLVSRSPALHPGDVQIVQAIEPPGDSPLRQLNNCICFSQKGARDLPSQLGGGDLDGDRFCIIFDERAKAKRLFSPADYPRMAPVNIGRPVEKRDMVDFFIDFMKSDQLAQIAVQHRVHADLQPGGTLSEPCLQLAELHSTAVDFSKTGIPVSMSDFPKRPKFRPDFEAPGPQVLIQHIDGLTLNEYMMQEQEDEDDDMPRFQYYESTKITGELFRAIDERGLYQQIRKHEADLLGESTVIHKVWEQVQRDCQLIEWKHLQDWARDIRDMYETSLNSVRTEYSDHPLRQLSELEAFMGNIIGKTGGQNRKQRESSQKMKEKVEENNHFIIKCILKNGREYSEEALERSMTCLAVSLEEGDKKRKTDSLLSFKYLAASVCLRQVQRFAIGA